MSENITNSSAAYRVLVSTSNPDTAMMFLGWFAKYGLFVALATELAHLSDASRFPQAPEGLVLDDSFGPAQLPSVIKVIRQQPGWAKTVILVVGTFTEELEIELLRAGASEVVGKPLRLHAMTYRLQRFLKARHG